MSLSFDQYVDVIESQFDAAVENGSDQELFMSGYLHGHFSLVVSQCEQSNNTSVPACNEAMLDSLQQAFDKKELEPEDQQQVLDYWHALHQTALN
ncbi:YfcL family protein [Neptunicella marina]|uniref:YfcL family protein n=1 Tax=Neptunicella marina TaxID=2125989 RepID=A0A8J6INJ4_9ALTE|nr:YfcL family protein [Neptunicella marina]MBC3764521.1 YfcL family protein [Neptunicella marina]